MNDPKKVEISEQGHRRKWILIKAYKNYGLYRNNQFKEIRECFLPHDLDMIPKRDKLPKEALTEKCYWKIGGTYENE